MSASHLAILIVLTIGSLAGSLHADPSPLVVGISQLRVSGAPGPVHPLSSAWDVIAAGDEDASYPSGFLLAREHGQGRILVVGHEGFLADTGLLDNGTFLVNATQWLDSGLKKVAYTRGHSEFIQGAQLQGYESLITPEGFTLQGRSGQVTSSFLSTISLLIVGNAWGSFTATEIDAIDTWVAQGGGLLLGGLGWSWSGDRDDYPMNVLGGRFEVRWLSSFISDPTHNENGSPIFHTFYPDATALSVVEAIQIVNQAHDDHPDLLTRLESDAALRLDVFRSHMTMAIPSREYGSAHPERQVVFDACVSLCEDHPSFYARGGALDPGQFPTSANLRERLWKSFRDSLDLTPARKTEMINAGQLSGSRRTIFEDHDVILLDNDRLDTAQLTVIDTYLTRVPATLHNLRSISVRDLLGTAPVPVSLDGPPYGVNIFGFDVGQATENSFPPDAAARIVDTFSAVTAHELNHIVDAFGVNGSPALSARKATLISDAGSEPLNYLRSRQAPGFFVSNPQEFFASISNQWFTDSGNTIEHGLGRFDAGRLDPINQALFFADVYSEGGDTTHVYTTDAQGTITHETVPVERDGQGRLVGLTMDGIRYKFELSGAGRVTGYTRLSFDVADLAGGQTATFTVTGGQPGQEVVILFGFDDGSFSGSQGDWCVEFDFHVPRRRAMERILFLGSFDAHGRFVRQLPVPGGASGIPVRFQAALAGTCPETCMSTVVESVVD